MRPVHLPAVYVLLLVNYMWEIRDRIEQDLSSPSSPSGNIPARNIRKGTTCTLEKNKDMKFLLERMERIKFDEDTLPD